MPAVVWFEFAIRRVHLSVSVNHAGKDVVLAGVHIDLCPEAEALSVVAFGGEDVDDDRRSLTYLPSTVFM